MTAVLVAAGLLAVEVAMSPAAQADEVPWDCTPTAYLFQSPQDRATTVYSVDLVTGASTRVGTIGDNINAVGFNRADNFMYGYDLTRNRLVRIGQDLALTSFDVRGLANIGWSAGEVDDDGHLWLHEETTESWAEIDLTGDRPTLVGQGRSTSSVGSPIDWAFIDGDLYGVVTRTVAGQRRGVLVEFDTATKTFINRGVLNTITGETNGYGAVYSDGDYLYASNNESGNIYRIDPGTLDAFLLSDGPASRNNDGSMCHTLLPTVTLVKEVDGRLVADDQFTVALRDASGDTVVDVTTTGTQTTARSVDQPVRRDRTYSITDNLTEGSTSLDSDYTGTLSCASESGTLPTTRESDSTWTIAIGDADDYVCTVTNTAAAPAPELELAKSVEPFEPFAAGDVLTYSFVVTNTGNVPVSDIAIDEVAFSGAGELGTATCAATTLAPRASTTCTATYTAQAADVRAGGLDNTARATGTAGGTVVSNEDSVELPAAAAPALEIEKTADPTSATQAGDTIQYEFAVTNTGNVSVTDIAVAEDSFSGAGDLTDATCEPTTLAPGESAQCLATYTVTQEDIDNGLPLTNSAHATGTGPGEDPVESDPDDAEVTVLQTPELTLEKVASAGRLQVRDPIDYRFKVTNSGNTTVTDLSITETAFSGTGQLGPVTCDATTLAPGEVTNCTARYRLTAADIAAGSVENTAIAEGSDPQGGPVVSNPSDAAIGIPEPVRIRPRIHTRVPDAKVTPGQRIHDRVRLSGLGRGNQVRATARLYGPFPTRSDARCRPAQLARSVSWRTGDGWSRTPKVRVYRPGVYTWQVSTRPTPRIGGASHPCGLRSETLTVAKPVYPPPVVPGGFSGTLLSPGLARAASAPRVVATGIGLDAQVLSGGVHRGKMDLPADVARVAWLRSSAGFDDPIGTTVIGGHVSDRHDRPGALYRLSRARLGQSVRLVDGGDTTRFAVVSKATYPRTARLPQRYFRTTGPHRLVLISCTDRVVYPNGHFHYTRYQVVVAKQVSKR